MQSSDFYDCERGMGKQVDMICFSLKSGSCRAFAMSLFDEVNLIPEGEIHFYSRFCTVKIKGRFLKPLYLQLIQRRVKEIREFSDAMPNENALEIESILIHSDYENH